MSDNFPEALKASLQVAILAALAKEGIELGDTASAEVVSPVLGQTEIPLTAGS